MPRKPKAPRICVLGGMILAATLHTSTLFAHETKTDERSSEVFKPGVEHTVPAIDAAAEHPPLYEGLGSMTMKVTTDSKMAQAYFDQGLVLTWAFNHAEARRAFVAAQSYDPDCALCYWGEAFVLGPNINDGMHEDAIAPAALAIGRAVSLKDRVSAKEKDLIEALAQRYDADPAADRSVLRLATYELMRTDTPVSVVLDEAIQLARRFGSESSPGFVNGVLDAVARELRGYAAAQDRPESNGGVA